MGDGTRPTPVSRPRDGVDRPNQADLPEWFKSVLKECHKLDQTREFYAKANNGSLDKWKRSLPEEFKEATMVELRHSLCAKALNDGKIQSHDTSATIAACYKDMVCLTCACPKDKITEIQSPLVTLVNKYSKSTDGQYTSSFNSVCVHWILLTEANMKAIMEGMLYCLV